VWPYLHGVTSDASKQSKFRRWLAAVGSVVAVPLHVADFVLGVPHSTEGSQTVKELERLEAMRRSGQLTDAEYKRAKDKVLGGSS